MHFSQVASSSKASHPPAEASHIGTNPLSPLLEEYLKTTLRLFWESVSKNFIKLGPITECLIILIYIRPSPLVTLKPFRVHYYVSSPPRAWAPGLTHQLAAGTSAGASGTAATGAAGTAAGATAGAVAAGATAGAAASAAERAPGMAKVRAWASSFSMASLWLGRGPRRPSREVLGRVIEVRCF